MQVNRDKYSNSTKNFKRPNTREDSSDLDEKKTERIAAMRSTSRKIFQATRAQKKWFQKVFFAKFREKLIEYLSLPDVLLRALLMRPCRLMRRHGNEQFVSFFENENETKTINTLFGHKTLFGRNGLEKIFFGQNLCRRVRAEILAEVCAAVCWPKFWRKSAPPCTGRNFGVSLPLGSHYSEPALF